MIAYTKRGELSLSVYTDADYASKETDRRSISGVAVVVVVVYLTLTGPLRIQPWSQGRRNQTKSNRKSEISRESRQKRTDKKVASKGHRRNKQQKNKRK